MIDSADELNKAIASNLIALGYKVNGGIDEYPRVEIISVTADEGVEKSNDDEYVTATIELLSKSKKGKAEIMAMRKAILNKFRYVGLDNVQNIEVVICRLESEQDLHESDEVDEIYRRILEFNILTHKL